MKLEARCSTCADPATDGAAAVTCLEFRVYPGERHFFWHFFLVCFCCCYHFFAFFLYIISNKCCFRRSVATFFFQSQQWIGLGSFSSCHGIEMCKDFTCLAMPMACSYLRARNSFAFAYSFASNVSDRFCYRCYLPDFPLLFGSH